MAQMSDVLRYIKAGSPPLPLAAPGQPPYGEEKPGLYAPVPPGSAVITTYCPHAAVALGGLGGNNAHGAGFLQALRHCGKAPALITCTSGQILYVAKYLEGIDVGEFFLRHMRESQPLHSLDANILFKMMTPWQKISPATFQLPLDIAANVMRSVCNAFSTTIPYSFAREAFNFWPARSLVSNFDNSFFENIADTLANSKDVGVMFNAYDFKTGCEYVYLNERAEHLTNHKSGEINRSRSWVQYRSIDADGVRNALRLYEYGFDANTRMLDGAYIRGLILSEIPASGHNSIHTIAVVRPLADHWLGPSPMSWSELRDMQTEVTFNSSYFTEREGIRRGNAHHNQQITIHEVPIMRQRGWWDYLVEDESIFRSAFWRGRDLINKQF